MPLDKEQPIPTTLGRRHDVDWLRVMAMGLLIVYHIMISFQPWGHKILFIQNGVSMERAWMIMEMINVWRIPILFMVSGMGVRFAMERRNWRQMLKDRTVRILVPLAFGVFFICPITVFFGLKYYENKLVYFPNTGHLWFLANIYLYVLILLPVLAYLRNHPNNRFLRLLSKLFRRPIALFLTALPLMIEAWIVNPENFPSYAKTAHGFWIGLAAFFTGFVFISLKDVFWKAAKGVRHSALALALLLYLLRMLVFRADGEPNALIAFESMCWMLAILGYGSLHLNKPSKKLAYLSQAVYPVYIIHMPVQTAISYFLLPLPLPATLKLAALLAGTFGICLLL
ncbi:MAG: acyltransferase, partial [Verrucomicrobiota bacterium]